MVNMVRFLLALASSVAFVLAQDEEASMTIEGRLQYPDQTPYNISTLISVNHGEYKTYSRTDGNFTIHDVKPGIYLIDVHSTVHHFGQVKCQFKPDAPAQGKPVFGCLEYVYHGAPKRVVDKLLVVTAYATYDYFETRRGFSVFSIVKNPMVIMMIITGVMMYFMPMMMEGLEPEEREKMKRQLEIQNNPSKALGELFGGGQK